MDRGHHVVAQRRSPCSRPRIALKNEPEWLDVSLDQLEQQHFVGFDALVHLAAHTPNPPYDSYERCLYWNAEAPLRMLLAAHKAGLSRWVVAGSCFEYGRAAGRYEFVPVTAPLEPSSSYPASKAAFSLAILALSRELNCRLFYGRIFQAFGEGEAPTRFWPSLRRAALAGEDFAMTSGKQVRDFTPVETVAQAFLDATEKQLEPGVPVVANIGTGHPRTLLDFATENWRNWAATGQLLPGSIPDRPGEVPRYVPEIR